MRHSIFVLSAVALVSACGGGGGSSNPVATVPSAPLVALNTGNYVKASKDSLTAPTSAQSSSSASKLITNSLTSDSKTPSADNMRSAQANKSASVACDGGGKITLNISFSLAQKFSPGDVITAAFASCTAPNLGSLSGGMEITLGQSTADTSNSSINISNLSFQSPTQTILSNGDFTLSLNAASASSSLIKLTFNNFSQSTTQGGTTVSNLLQNFTVTSTQTGTTTSAVLAGDLTSSSLNGERLTVSTLQPLITKKTDTTPSSGQLILNGANGSKVRITAQNVTSALIELDANGDGTYETQTTKPWAEIF
jgi:hypothetical protein